MKLEKKFLMVIMALLVGGLIGCAKRNVYLKDDSETIRLKTGEKAPFDGVLSHEGAFSDLLENLEKCDGEK